jgi:hypothetical protein
MSDSNKMPKANVKQMAIGIDFGENLSSLPTLESNKMPKKASKKTSKHIE